MDVAQTLDNSVRAGVYRFFAEQARAPVAAELANQLGEAQATVEESFRRLAADHLLVLAPGTPYIWMANPFSALPTPFSVQVEDRTWFGNCIWDAVGIVMLLGGDGMVTTWCPDCAAPLRVEIVDSSLVTGQGVAHFANPAYRWWDDIGFN
jgi:hypothetical protein